MVGCRASVVCVPIALVSRMPSRTVLSVSEAADQLQDASGVPASVEAAVHQVAEFVGVPPGVLLAVALVAEGVMVMRRRRKQRSEGWARS